MFSTISVIHLILFSVLLHDNRKGLIVRQMDSVRCFVTPLKRLQVVEVPDGKRYLPEDIPLG